MKRAIVASAWALLFVTVASNAHAAIWQWGCQGQLDKQQVLFTRSGMAIVDSTQKMGNVRRMLKDEPEIPPGATSVNYDVEEGDGLSEKMVFGRKDDPNGKITLTERSSKKISGKARVICGRDETTDIYRKVYTFQRDSEPPRPITMRCIEYQLSTRGGRPGCN